MPIRHSFKPGQFCWIDLNAHSLADAGAWYCELFGWTPFQQESSGPPYTFFMKGEAAAAAGGQMDDEMKAAGVPQCWNNYVYVKDCAATEKRAAELGATIVCPTIDVPGHGKLCFLSDPGGAVVALWQDGDEKGGPGVLMGEHGSLSWNELMCRDVAKSREFYGQLFGWAFEDMPMGDVNYTVIKVGDEQAGGMMAMEGENFEGVPEHWMVYFAVDDCDAMAARVEKSGGTVCIPPTEIPVGKFSVVSDPQGGYFSIIETNEQAS